MSGSWQAERGSRRTLRLPHEDPRVGVAVGVGPMEFKLNRSRQTPQTLFSLARIWNSVPVVTCCSWKHTLTVESCSVHQQTGKCLDALHKILHTGGCNKTQRHCLYEGIASQLCSFPERSQDEFMRFRTLFLCAYLNFFRAFP